VRLAGGVDLCLLDLVSGGVPLDRPQAQVVAYRDDNSLRCADADHVVLWLGFARLRAHGSTVGHHAGSLQQERQLEKTSALAAGRRVSASLLQHQHPVETLRRLDIG
jgi:hypothetical protein